MRNYLELDERGFFKAPNESEEEFLKKTSYWQELRRFITVNWIKKHFKIKKISESDFISHEDIQSAISNIKEKYMADCSWITGFYSNKGLTFIWGGAAVMLEPEVDEDNQEDSELEEPDVPIVIFQINPKFKKKRKFLIYSVDEIIAHECIHIMRASFEGCKYEEIFAYQTSPSKFRKLVGPLFKNTLDCYMFLCGQLFFIGGEICGFFLDKLYIAYISSLPFFVIALYLSGSLFFRYRSFHKTLEIVKSLFGEYAEAVMLRCSEEELDIIRKRKPKNIKELKEIINKEDIRWKVIFERFGYQSLNEEQIEKENGFYR